MSQAPVSIKTFLSLLPTLKAKLTNGLLAEIADCALPDMGGDPASDLWDTPRVDSKTVAKLSPIVKEVVGRRLDPRWIRKGGYSTVEEAVADLIAHLKSVCVAGPVPAVAIASL